MYVPVAVNTLFKTVGPLAQQGMGYAVQAKSQKTEELPFAWVSLTPKSPWSHSQGQYGRDTEIVFTVATELGLWMMSHRISYSYRCSRIRIASSIGHLFIGMLKA